MRAGEANSLLWINTDTERRTITLNQPEKRSNPRIFKVSTKLIGMLNRLPKNSKTVFGTTIEGRKSPFYRSLKLAARKLKNPRLSHINFHTFRRWKATMLYHHTKDILYVKEFLGHRRIQTTLLYVQLEQAFFKETTDKFTARVASKPEEIKALLESGL